MASSPTLSTKTALSRIVDVLKHFAKDRGWRPEDYEILFRVLEQWGKISVLLITKDFGGLTNREIWDQVFDYMEKELGQGPDIGFSLGLSVRERNQVEQGGMYSIPEEYVAVEDLLPSPTLTD
jgi:hypothetical protein